MSHKHEHQGASIEERIGRHVPIDASAQTERTGLHTGQGVAGWLKDHPGNGSLFESIARAAGELKAEADRVSTGDRDLKKTITCGELQEILTNTTKAVLGLRAIEFFEGNGDRSEMNLRSEIAVLENQKAELLQRVSFLESSKRMTLEDRLLRVEKELFGDAPR